MERYLVSMEWVKDHLQDDDLVIADCRFILGAPETGKKMYDVDHIPGAVYFDLEKVMSGAKQVHGGRHPLPDWDSFSAKLGEAGIDHSKKVIVYDDQGGAMASRLWWMLEYLGHSSCYLMDGGYSQWKEQGFPITAEVEMPVHTVFEYRIQPNMLVDIEEVKRKKDHKHVALIDSREEKRYLGIEEPIDPVAGHIPGAMNYFWKGVLANQGTWKNREQLKQQFANLDSNQEIIVYCGSGVSACPNILGLREAGFKNVKLYSGSWSDWCSYPENPIAKGKE